VEVVAMGWQSEFRAEVRDNNHDGRSSVVVVVGELDVVSAPTFDLALEMAAADGPQIVVDMAGVTFFGSAGVGSLVRAANRVENKEGGRLSLRNPSPVVLNVLHVLGLDEHFSIEDEPTPAAGTPATTT
jgi:anti-anti-sigma factor